MTIRGWKTQFKEIRKEFGYLEKDDLISAKKLDSLLKGKNSKNQFQNMIKGKTVFIIGAGPSLTRSLKYIKKSKNVVNCSRWCSKSTIRKKHQTRYFSD